MVDVHVFHEALDQHGFPDGIEFFLGMNVCILRRFFVDPVSNRDIFWPIITIAENVLTSNELMQTRKQISRNLDLAGKILITRTPMPVTYSFSTSSGTVMVEVADEENSFTG